MSIKYNQLYEVKDTGGHTTHLPALSSMRARRSMRYLLKGSGVSIVSVRKVGIRNGKITK